MDQTVRKISAEDINPRHNWGRALPSLGIMGVDFEERVDYRRMHRYRLGRVLQARRQDAEAGVTYIVYSLECAAQTWPMPASAPSPKTDFG